MAFPQIVVAVSVPFPTRVLGAGPMALTKANGVWTVSLDFTKLAQHTPPVSQYANTFILTYNSATGLYERATFVDLQAAAQAGLPIGIEVIHDAGGQPIQTGMKAFVSVPFDMTLSEVVMMADQAGSIVMDIYRCTEAAFNPPTHPAVADKITGATPPTITANVKVDDAALTGWTKTLSKGDILGFTCVSCLTITRITIALIGTRDAASS